MRFAVLSDIHSNYAALRAVIADAESRQPDYWLFLGDYVTDCPYPHRTVEFLRDFSQTHACLMIRGNREDYMINQRKAPQAWEYGSKCGALRYCYENLTGRDLDWLASQPFTLRPELPGCEPFIMCHGSPDSINYLFHTNTREAEIMISRLGEYGCRLMLCGHSHIPFIFKREGRMLVNPGALGMPGKRTDQSTVCVPDLQRRMESGNYFGGLRHRAHRRGIQLLRASGKKRSMGQGASRNHSNRN